MSYDDALTLLGEPRHHHDGGRQHRSRHEFHLTASFYFERHLPLLLHPAPQEVGVVGLGLGLGITLSATERNPEIRQIQLIELTPEMPKAHQHLEEITGGVLRRPKVNLRIDSGRIFRNERAAIST